MKRLKFHNLIRNFSTYKNLKVSAIQLTTLQNTRHQCLNFEFEDPSKTLHIPLVWLRDHCRSPQNYNWETNQRKNDATNLFKYAKLKSYNLDKEQQNLKVLWENGCESNFRIADLLNWAVIKEPAPSIYTLWDSSTLSKIPHVSSKNFDFLEFSKIFMQYGVITITDVDATDEKATRKLCEKIGPIHNTFYGYFWVFGVNTEEDETGDRQDTAYSNEEIGLHNDGTYFEQTPGIQVFHCLVPAKVGGETILFDGFYAAEKLRQNYPEYFEILSKVPIEHHYLEGMSDVEDERMRFENASVKLYSRSIAPVITCFNGKIVQVRLNPYDRAPFRSLNFSSNSEKTALETIKFYEAYEKFSQLCNAPEAAIKIALKPGTVIFIDNYRVFHSRTEFQGSRKMCGCYLSRDNFLAKVRPLLKIDDL